jgi:hypothetical protein
VTLAVACRADSDQGRRAWDTSDAGCQCNRPSRTLKMRPLLSMIEQRWSSGGRVRWEHRRRDDLQGRWGTEVMTATMTIVNIGQGRRRCAVGRPMSSAQSDVKSSRKNTKPKSFESHLYPVCVREGGVGLAVKGGG